MVKRRHSKDTSKGVPHPLAQQMHRQCTANNPMARIAQASYLIQVAACKSTTRSSDLLGLTAYNKDDLAQLYNILGLGREFESHEKFKDLAR